MECDEGSAMHSSSLGPPGLPTPVRVAVKVLHPAVADDESFLRRFRAEAQSAASLSHPHLLAVFDWSGDDDTPFDVSENQADWLRRQQPELLASGPTWELAAPPPVARTSSTGTSSSRMISRESRRAKITPSITARVMCATP